MNEIIKQALYKFVKSYSERHGYAPTYREMLEGVTGLSSTSHVSYYVSALEKEGKIERDPFRSRTVRIR